MAIVTNFILLLSIIGLSHQQEGLCDDVQQKLQALSEAVQTLCASATPTNWTSVTRTKIGNSSLSDTGSKAFDIPDIIPSNAKEILALVVVQVGNTDPQGRSQFIKIYTQQDSERYEKYVYIVAYRQNALVTNTENLWFPLTSNRLIYLDVSYVYTGSVNFVSLEAIGYR